MATENYCSMHLTRGQRSVIAKLRLGILPINIELGRYNGIERGLRMCNICNTGEVEDEIHFLLKCVKYEERRNTMYILAGETVTNFMEMNDIEKVHILTSHNNLIRKTCKFIKECLEERNNVLKVG